ncbi:MAG: hypothetical protein U0791_08565 [Gemmataceae bacterium]
MLRFAFCAGLLLATVFTLLESTGRGQPGATSDRVYYRDKKDGQIKEVDGELKAAPGGYQIVTPDKKTAAVVSAVDLVRVIPADLPADLKTAREPANLEAKREWEKAKVLHSDMAKKTGLSDKSRKYLEFRIAYVTARAADDTPEEEKSQAKAGEAIKLLETFLTGNKAGWEVYAAGSTCARLQVSETTKDGDKERRHFDEASRTWGKIAKAADLSAELKLEAAMQEIDTRIRGRQLAEARGLIDDALKVAPAGPAKDRLNIYALAVKHGDAANPEEGVKAIEAEIAKTKTKDPGVLAAAFGMMGELYLAKEKPREAMWQFLWVEVVYNQDRDEVIKTLARLSDVFRLQGDDERAKAYREKLRRYRGSL